jgi:hypothetical protein
MYILFLLGIGFLYCALFISACKGVEMRGPVCIPRHKHDPYDRLFPDSEAGNEENRPQERHPQMKLAGAKKLKLVHEPIVTLICSQICTALSGNRAYSRR